MLSKHEAFLIQITPDFPRIFLHPTSESAKQGTQYGGQAKTFLTNFSPFSHQLCIMNIKHCKYHGTMLPSDLVYCAQDMKRILKKAFN